MDFFMPAERVLYDRSYFFSDEALEEYTAEVADQNGVDIDEVASSSELMDKVRWEIDNAIERDLSDELAFIESTPAELQDDYPTPVHVFTYDGRDSEPVHRTDVHLDGDAMTLDPVKGTPAHNGAQAHGGDRHPADLAKAASAAANRTAGSHADEAGGIKH